MGDCHLGTATEVADGRFKLISTKLPSSALLIGKGTTGAIVYTPTADLLNEAVRLRSAGNVTGADAVEARLKALAGLMTHPNGKAGCRAALKYFAGVDLGPPRIPLVGITHSAEAAMFAAFKRNDFPPQHPLP